ncbi:unnamed protein product [Paramecium primaurelia]|uniref:Uncharacterized protein n=1 Tax=Paramecium primaurelia TaxID=5886 RepID=A0A8S1LFG0_PARPR|nr:unnamed protein product [Paramecium primaurelia]
MRNQSAKKETNQIKKKSTIKPNINLQQYSFLATRKNFQSLTCSTQQDSNISNKQFQSLRQLSPTDQAEKKNQQTKYSSQRLIKMNSKEFQDSNKIMKGSFYKKISPQINMNNDNIEVNFVREFNLYNESNSIRENQKNVQIDKEITIQEVFNSKVQVKSSRKLTNDNAQFQAAVGKGILNSYKKLFINSESKNDQVSLCSKNQPLSARTQKINLKQYK